ncbi:MAG: hypothetical protein WC816_10765 [Sphingomonas sp.]
MARLSDADRTRAIASGHWFAPKRYGLGATPVTWQGWALTMAFVFLLLGDALRISNLPARIVIGALLVLGFTYLAWLKTDGGWRWRWGSRD